jgi:hypothetical protein
MVDRTRSRAAARKPRAALAWGLAAFIALQAALVLTTEIWLPFLRDPDYGFKMAQLEHRLRAVRGRPLTVIMLGSSRTVFGLKAKPLEERLARDAGCPCVAFNFGLTGAGPVLELVGLNRLLAAGVHPDVLLVEVLPSLLGDQSPSPPEAYNLPAERLWLSELPLLEPYGYPRARYEQDWWESWALPWYTRRLSVLSRVAPAWLPWNCRKDWFRLVDEWGWVYNPISAVTPEEYRRGVEQARRGYLPILTRFRLGAPSCQALRDLLTRCRREGITAALVVMPEGSEFRSMYPHAVWAQIETCLTGLSREYGLPFINAREWVADGLFLDSHHMCPEGADVFTDRLGLEVAALLARSRLAKVRP